jgi:hypothetical protein
LIVNFGTTFYDVLFNIEVEVRAQEIFRVDEGILNEICHASKIFLNGISIMRRFSMEFLAIQKGEF